MQKHDAEWYRQQAREKQERDAERRQHLKYCVRRDLAELEALKVALLKEARAERKKNSRHG